MPTGKIPFGAAVVKNTDEEFLPENNVQFYDGYLTETGVSTKRPGLSTISAISVNSAGFCNGMFWWPPQKKLVAVVNNRVFLFSYVTGTWGSVEVTSAVPMSGLITFAYDATYFYLADGGKIMYSAGVAADLTDLADADAPTACTHVAYLDGYIIGNNGNRRFYYSAVEDGLTWSALDFASAAGNPDNIVGLVVFNRELFLIGEQTTEIWYNDGETPFSRRDGGFIERGCIAPSSILKCKLGVIWLDTERNLVLSNGGQPDVISADFKSVIDSFSVVSDCETQFIEWKSRAFIVLNFRTEGRTLVYNLTQSSWSEWGEWDSSAIAYKPWRGRVSAWCPDWNMQVVGDRSSNNRYMLSDSVYQDGGSSIRFLKRTGFINHGNDSLKRCNKVVLKIRRGFGDITVTNAPKLMLRWRNDGSSTWSNIVELDMGKAGDGIHLIETYPRGAYRTRQYELSCTENIPVAFLDAEEDYTVLR